MKKTEINSSHKRLDSKTVLVTRARAQAEEMTVLLEGLGAKVIHVPTIEFIPPDDLALLDNAIRRLEEYDWIIFTSSNAVDFFIKRLRETRSESVAVLGTRSICAIGTATARALEEAGIRANVVAQESTSEGVLRELVEHIGGENIVRRLKILIPRAKVAREILPSRLRDQGAHVDVVETYQTVLPQIKRSSLKKLFEETRIDVITFTSSSTVSNLATLLGLTDLSDVLQGTLVACIGPVTAETARSFGLTNIIQPDVYTATELVRVIATAISDVA
ncbi:MAG TPA: uroporphyrinogen-III synthase [Blastocatellia bacterium]|nr:uroporphyrinogen-III synthase [Blastocatellia bacterium]